MKNFNFSTIFLVVYLSVRNPRRGSRSFLIAVFLLLIVGCDKNNLLPQAPELGTADASEVTSTTAMAGGSLLNSGDSQVTELGICLSFHSDPTIHSSRFSSEALSGNFTVELKFNYYPDTLYYFRAYALTSDGGVAYGPVKSFTAECISSISDITDIDGNTYKSFVYQSNEWLGSNLNVTKFRNGDAIFKATSISEWTEACNNGIPAYCNYGFEDNNANAFGKLYNRAAILNFRGLAPEGWSVPDDADWDQLKTNFGGQFGSPGLWLKSDFGWENDGNGHNRSCFSAMPGGRVISTFQEKGTKGFWWTTAQSGSSSVAICYSMSSNTNGVSRTVTNMHYSGLSVRCIKN